MRHYAEASRIGEHFVAVAYETARGDSEFQLGAASVVGYHLFEVAFAHADAVHDHAYVFGGDFHDQPFDRLALNAVDFFDNNFGPTYLEFIAFAAHCLYQYRQMQLASAVYLKAVCAVRLFHAHAHVGLHFLKQSRAQVSASDILALFTCKRRVVDHKEHG